MNSIRLSISRNIEGYKFPHKLDDIERTKLTKLLEDNVISKYGFIKTSFYDYYSNESYISYMLGNINFFINNHSHLEVTIEGEIEDSTTMLNSILDLLRKIEQDLDFSFNMKFGYLNADISLVGNGLRISTIINIPSIVRNGKIINVIKASNNNNIQINKLNGFDEIYTISNKSSNKGTEIFILENTINFIDDINNYEMRLSQEKYESQRLDFEDRIYRAQAIFNSARIIRLSEAEQILGDLKTGNALGIIDEKYNEWLEFLILNRLSKDNFSRCV